MAQTRERRTPPRRLAIGVRQCCLAALDLSIGTCVAALLLLPSFGFANDRVCYAQQQQMCSDFGVSCHIVVTPMQDEFDCKVNNAAAKYGSCRSCNNVVCPTPAKGAGCPCTEIGGARRGANCADCAF